MNKTEHHSPWAPPLMSVRVCVCNFLYKGEVNSLRQCINTHDAAGGAGRRVRVSQHTHITPPLSLSPFRQSIRSSSPLYSSSSISPAIIFHLVTQKQRISLGKRKCDLGLVMLIKTSRGVNKVKQSIRLSQQDPFTSAFTQRFPGNLSNPKRSSKGYIC